MESKKPRLWNSLVESYSVKLKEVEKENEDLKREVSELIKKWDERIDLHRSVCSDPLMYTKEDRLKNSHYAQALCGIMADLKQIPK